MMFILLGAVFGHMKEKRIIWNRQHGSIMDKSYLTLIAFYDGMNIHGCALWTVDELRPFDFVYLYFSMF